MNRTINYISYAWVMLLTLCFSACADQTFVDNKPEGEGTLLNIYASVNKASTRLAELGSWDNMNEASGLNNKYKHIGLYIYYEDDYTDKDGHTPDLSKPYIRNLECKVVDGVLTPISGEKIYIYDRMTIVAFYPYNESMSQPAHYFSKKSDELAYPISESDYCNQKYIPYRAQTTVNPTNAYKIHLGFGPQQTVKVEVVLTATDDSSFPKSVDLKDGKIKLLPTIDRLADKYTDGADRREFWVDGIANFPNDGKGNATTPVGGKYARRYTAYVWKSLAKTADSPHHDDYTHQNNILYKGEVLFESDVLTLVVPETVDLSAGTVYRYGYDMDNGEIFIPTAGNIICDATSLQAYAGGDAYQVCAIDLKDQTWKPLATASGTYDGGGHAINNLTIDYTLASSGTNDAPNKESYGLFADMVGSSTLMNINLVNPTITVDYSQGANKDACYVGAICGLMNPELLEEELLKKIMKSLPDELSETVKRALAKDMLQDTGVGTSKIRGCKVTNPTITVTGNNVHVGGLVGGAGDAKQRGEIKDSYTTEGNIAVNATDATKATYTLANVSGFCGLLSNGSITNSYSNIDNIHGYVKDGGTTGTSKDIATGFCNLLSKLPTGVSATTTDCFSKKLDTNAKVLTGATISWPLFKDDPKATNHSLSGTYGGNPWPCYKWEDSWKDMHTSSTYPTLIWETPFTVENK